MWIILSLTAAIFSAIFHLTAQNMRLDGNVFMIYRGVVIVAFLSPFLILNPMLFSGRFYMMAFIQGIVACYSDYLAYKVNQRRGAETVSSIIPFSVIIIFFLWCAMRPELVTKYVQTPAKTMGILISFSGVIYALKKYYAVKFTKKAMIDLSPILILSSIIAVLYKLIMNEGNEHQLLKATQLAWIVSFVVGVAHFLIFMYKKKNIQTLFVMQNMKQSVAFVFLSIVIILKALSICYALNPAYVSCLIYTTLIWVMILGKFVPYFHFKSKDVQVAKKYKLLFVFSIILLILCTS